MTRFNRDGLNPSIGGQNNPIQTESIPALDQACQNSAFYVRMDRLEWEVVRCIASTSERLQRTQESLSRTTELVAQSREAIARSVHLLKANRRNEDRSTT
jgi:hypothetical protein